MRRSSHAGFTLVELLVVIAIIGVLVGLLLPAVQMAREAARKTECSSRIGQLAKAAQQFEMSKKRYPGYLEFYGKGNTGKIGTWAVAILPYLEQRPIYDLWADDSKYADWQNASQAENFYPNINLFVCNSDYTSLTKEKLARNSFVCNAGFLPVASNIGMLPGYGSNPSANSVQSQRSQNGVFTNQLPAALSAFGRDAKPPVNVRSESIGDGLSNTVSFSENIQADQWGYFKVTDDSTRYSIGMVWLYRSEEPVTGRPSPDSVAPVNKINGPKGNMINAPVNSMESARPASWHTGVANAAFLDGSVRTLSEEMAYKVYQALLTPKSRSSDMPDLKYVLKDDDY